MKRFVLDYICLIANLICFLPYSFGKQNSRLLPSPFTKLTLTADYCILTGYFHHTAEVFHISVKTFECLSACQSIFIPTLIHIPALSLSTACSLNCRSTVLSSPFLFPSTPNHHVPVPTLNLSFNPPLSVAGSLRFTPSPSPSAPCARPSYPALPTTTLL